MCIPPISSSRDASIMSFLRRYNYKARHMSFSSRAKNVAQDHSNEVNERIHRVLDDRAVLQIVQRITA